MKRWKAFRLSPYKPVHVYPLEDLIDHEIHDKPCPCKPKVQENGRLLIHSSLDGRELSE